MVDYHNSDVKSTSLGLSLKCKTAACGKLSVAVFHVLRD